MSNYKVETFIERWHDDGLIFGTRDEAVNYALTMLPTTIRRIVEVDEPANYRMENGKLLVGKKRFDPANCTWEEYVKGMGIC